MFEFPVLINIPVILNAGVALRQSFWLPPLQREGERMGDVRKKWWVTYTKHVKQKRKVYQDGSLRLLSNNKVLLLLLLLLLLSPTSFPLSLLWRSSQTSVILGTGCVLQCLANLNALHPNFDDIHKI